MHVALRPDLDQCDGESAGLNQGTAAARYTTYEREDKGVPAEEHLQFMEVLDYLTAKQGCAIVHPETHHEVTVGLDSRSNWFVQTILPESPGTAPRKNLKSVGLKTKPRETRMNFGPQAGKTVKFFTVSGDFKSAETSARAALSVFEILWRVHAGEWLWVTAAQYDDRGKPNRPGVWPPAPER